MRRPWPWSWILAPLAVILLLCSLLYFMEPEDNTRYLITHTCELLGAACGLVGMLHARVFIPSRRERTAWLLLAFGVLALVIGDFIWAIYALAFHQDNPFPSYADIAYLLGYLLIWGGLFYQIAPRMRTLFARLTLFLEMLITVLAALTLLWFLSIGPALQDAGHLSPLAKILIVTYPLLDFSFLICVMSLLLRSWQPARWPLQLMLAGAALVLVVADTLYGYQEYSGTYQNGHWLDILWPVSYLMFGWAALMQARVYAYGLTSDDRTVELPSHLRILLPYALVLGACVSTLLVCVTPLRPEEENALLLGTVIVFGAVTIRQWLLFEENRRLYRDLNDAYQESIRTARTDPITTLPNYRFFLERLTEEIARAERYQTPLSLIFIDLDYFKEINDTYGHLAADMVLQRVGMTMSQHIRTSDLLARYAGDEFVLLLPQTTLEQAGVLAERLRRSVSEMAIPMDTGGTLFLSASLGLSAYPSPSATREALISDADAAMYRGKREGRNCVVPIKASAGIREAV